MDNPCAESLLNKLLNEMDGLKGDADILFLLTTNRPEALEQALAARPGRVDQAIGDCVAGNVGCWTQNGQRLVGYWIGKEHWGKGVATQMLSLLLRLVADRPSYAYVARHNVASIRVLEKCGFVNCEKAAVDLGESASGIEELVYVIHTTSVDPESTSHMST